MVGSQRSLSQSNNLLRVIIGVALALGVFHAVLVLVLGPGPVLAELPWYVPVIQSFAGLASLSIAFLAFGRYRVLREPETFWTGLAFIAFAVSIPFYVLTFPGLLPDGQSFILSRPDTSVWLGDLGLSLLGIFLVAAVVVPWPKPGMPAERWWFWLVIAMVIAIAALATLLVILEQLFPRLIVDGVYSPLQNLWRSFITMIYGAGLLLSAYRYRQTGNVLIGYVLLTEVMLILHRLVAFMYQQRYDFWWYWAGILMVGGFSVMLFGLLSEYVGLYRRERENARELAALLQVTDPSLARQGLEPLLRGFLERMVAIMDAKAGAILLLDPARQELVLRCGVGIPAEEAVGFRVRVGENFSGRVAARNAVFWRLKSDC